MFDKYIIQFFEDVFEEKNTSLIGLILKIISRAYVLTLNMFGAYSVNIV